MTEQALEQESDMAGMVQLSDREYLKSMTNMLRTLIEKVDNMQE